MCRISSSRTLRPFDDETTSTTGLILSRPACRCHFRTTYSPQRIRASSEAGRETRCTMPNPPSSSSLLPRSTPFPISVVTTVVHPTPRVLGPSSGAPFASHRSAQGEDSVVLPPMSKTCDLPPCRHREGPIDIDPRRFSLWITPTHRGRHVKAMVKADVKATDLKGLHGKIRKRGYASGDLKGHTYADSKPTLEKCKAHDVSVHIYPPRSIDAQKPPFRRSNARSSTATSRRTPLQRGWRPSTPAARSAVPVVHPR